MLIKNASTTSKYFRSKIERHIEKQKRICIFCFSMCVSILVLTFLEVVDTFFMNIHFERTRMSPKGGWGVNRRFETFTIKV